MATNSGAYGTISLRDGGKNVVKCMRVFEKLQSGSEPPPGQESRKRPREEQAPSPDGDGLDGCPQEAAEPDGEAAQPQFSMQGSNLNEVILGRALARSGGVPGLLPITGVRMRASAGVLEMTMSRAPCSLHDHVYRMGPAARAAGAMRILKDLVRTLHALHSRGVAHCDLKPSNIVVMEDGSPFVIDLGSARLMARGNPRERLVLCTFPFCAPEALRAFANMPDPSWRGPSPACDAYSLGATVFYLLFQQYLYRIPRRDFSAPLQVGSALRHYKALISTGARSPPLPPCPPGTDEELYNSILPGLLALDPVHRLTIADLHTRLFGTSQPGTPERPVPALLGGCGSLAAGAPDKDKGRHNDVSYLMLENATHSPTRLLKPCTFILSVSLRDRFKELTPRALQTEELDACGLIAECALYPDSDRMDGPITRRVCVAMQRVLTRLDFDVLVNTCDCTLEVDHGVEEADLDRDAVFQTVLAHNFSSRTPGEAAERYLAAVGAPA